MRKIYVVLYSAMMLFSCHGDDDFSSTTNPPVTNTAPSTPALIFPVNSQTCTAHNLELNWGLASDPEGDTVSYVVEVATNSDFSTLFLNEHTTTTNQTVTLEKGVIYYWRVKAVDSEENESEYATVQTFFSEPDASIHTLPAAPIVTSPSLGASVSGSTANLAWTAEATNGDELLYDLYFGDTNPPVLYAEDIAVNSTSVPVVANTRYYWRVIVKDAYQNATIGQLWNFETE